ncbi:caspase-10 isoform X3 [Sminthopsis crassicaudata]|uniref:caspase-10 isoform X3 n=1 Tax=Sminthopsis crassicaudata TaxID=9301 RepID=UPI003D6870A2
MPRSCINMEDDNYLEKLLFISENLGHNDIEALKFLCSDLISLGNLENINSARQLFEQLMRDDLLNKENCFLVAELLFLIKQKHLLCQIGYTKEEVQKELSTKGKISSYRIMLYNLSEEITIEDFQHAKFLLRDSIPKPPKCFLSLLRNMEKQELLSKNYLEKLEFVCKNLSKSLLKRINQYKTEKEEKNLSVASGLAECLWNTSLQENMEQATRYEMTSKHRGLCIIFNNCTFKTMDYREGSCKDAACQGKDAQEGVLLEADARSVNNSLSVPKNIPQMYIPKEADFLLGMATVDGCFAVRHIEKGSWYIQALCHYLKHLVPREEDILSILTMVNNEVSQQAADKKGKIKQMPQPAFTLRKKVIFPVPSDKSPL